MVKVGDGATISNGTSGCDAATVVNVKRNGKMLTVQYDTAILRNKEHSQLGVRYYRYRRDRSGQKVVYTLRRNRLYVLKGQNDKSCLNLCIGNRRTYDSHF